MKKKIIDYEVFLRRGVNGAYQVITLLEKVPWLLTSLRGVQALSSP